MRKFFLGGRHLATDFGYQIPAGTIGECWAISGHPHGPNIITNGQYKGQLLPKAYQQHPELFGNPHSSVFPLLTKILDANASLSIQVHPDDAYAEEHEHELGKTECWYVIHAEPGAYLTYGHTAKTRDELIKMIDNHQWSKLFSRKPVKTGDFVYVPSGTIHALNKGIIVLETQQSSDTTYRIYDYDRRDKKTGQLRQLHLKQAKDVTTVPFTEPQINPRIVHDGSSIITTLISQPDSPFFTIYKWEINDQTSLTHDHGPYTLVSIIDGNGILTVDDQQYSLHKGDHFIIPATVKDDGMIARQLRDRDYYDADYIIAMDQMNVRNAKDMAPAGLDNKVHGIFEATLGKENCYIVDPWITHRFQNTYDSLSEALPNWLAKLKKESQPPLTKVSGL